MTDTLRVLVTGSRSWTDEGAVRDELVAAAARAGVPLSAVTVVHGHCPDGADALADRVARRMGMQVERHPAKWRRPDGTVDKGAGFARNAEMVDLGADECLAFIGPCTSPRCRKPRPHDSHGATHTADLAEAARIPTRKVRP